MTVLQAIAMALSCFTRIPMPQVEWNERNMRYLLAAFPLAGAVVGSCYLLWWLACDALGFSALFRAAGLVLLPLAITGGIHMDGFADVIDAHSSHAGPERKRQILKDPHVGSFAVMGICGYLIANFALASELDARLLPAYACIPVVSRCLSAYAAVSWPTASPTGMLASMSGGANKAAVRRMALVELCGVVTGMMWCNAGATCVSVAVAVALLAWLKHFSAREFGGMSGDLLGFYVQVSELAMLAGIVLTGRVM